MKKALIEMEYEKKDGILYPKIQVNKKEEPLGKYGQMALKYLKENHLNRYNLLLATGELMPIMHQVNEEAYNQLDLIMEQILKEEKINKESTMEVYKKRIQAKAIAEEIILKEIILKIR
ncbi:TnpV protein [Clostridium botulinum]|nr:TnpV protein [Clostridium botulinum]NFI02314.1 TnpV protein [Clostridium botulinum]NFI64716.1 TnpV protein [Clostridium botulinum]NFJ45630.1 TnpV protein [Clostridium botulinum]NFJ49055.1 TnpV protein [Clostridium botulinum]